jgi:hypothetical protein
VRPTVEEQLLGLRAVLQGVVAPEVRAPYPSDVLATVVGALERLGGDWATVPAALRSESGALDGLLADALDSARPVVGPDTAAAIDAVRAQAGPDWLDPAAARAHYERRRGLLADVVRALAPDGAAAPALWSAVITHLRDHLAGPL